MNLFKAKAVRNVEEATKAIPVIDFAPAFKHEPGGLDAVAREVRCASERVGFFYLAGHGVAAQVVDAAFAASREFHALPLETKQRLALNENNIGYLAPNQSIQGASTVHKATRPNYNESFFISHDRGADHPDVVGGTPLRGRNQWPEGIPGCGRRWSATSRPWREWDSRCSPCWPVPSTCRPTTSHRSSRTRRTSIYASCTTRLRT